MSGWVVLSGCSGRGGDLGPGQKGLGPIAAMIGGVGGGGTAEKIGDLVMGGEEALSLSGRFEQLHDPLPSSGRLVTVFRPVVQALVLPMFDPGHDRPLRRTIACQLVGDHNPRGPTVFSQGLAEQPFGRRRVPAALDQMSSTTPCWSTARHSQCFRPAMEI